MNLDHIRSILIHGSNLENILFQIAIYFAELGSNLWFISPEQFDDLPIEITSLPDKDVLKLITFLYLNDHKELLKHLNEVHTWHRMPEIIIVNSLDYYIKTEGSIAASMYIVSSLLDASRTCAKKHGKMVYLIGAYHNLTNTNDAYFNTCIDLYFNAHINVTNVDNFNIDVIL